MPGVLKHAYPFLYKNRLGQTLTLFVLIHDGGAVKRAIRNKILSTI